jgi:hypothetical protein
MISSRDAARRRTLFVIREIARMSPDSITDILALDADDAVEILDAVPVRLAAAACFIRLRTDHCAADDIFAALLDNIRSTTVTSRRGEISPADHNQNFGIKVLASSSELAQIVGPSFAPHLVDDEHEIARELRNATALIHEIWPSILVMAEATIDFCIGLAGPRGDTRAFSDRDVPGLVAFSVNNPPALLAEQLIYEATSLALGLRIEDHESLQETLSRMPGCYSPFTEAACTAETVLHEATSYGCVLKFWQLLHQRKCLDPSWLDYEDESLMRRIVAGRVSELTERVALGWKSLVCVSQESEASDFSAIYEEFVGDHPPSGHDTDDQNTIGAMFAPIHRAELVLAMDGQKVSRFSIGIRSIPILTALLKSGIPHCYSLQAFASKPDPKLAGFANAFSASCHISNAGSEHEVLCYVAKERADARQACDMDADDAAGDAFGIPPCCQAFFRRHWAATRESGGDLFSLLMKKNPGTDAVKVPWQCNAAAMYGGAGLCWHFPCSFECEATVDAINRRQSALARLDKSLGEFLSSEQKRAFLWSRAGGYGFLPFERMSDAKCCDVRWTGIPPLPAHEPALAATEVGWRLVVPR